VYECSERLSCLIACMQALRVHHRASATVTRRERPRLLPYAMPCRLLRKRSHLIPRFQIGRALSGRESRFQPVFSILRIEELTLQKGICGSTCFCCARTRVTPPARQRLRIRLPMARPLTRSPTEVSGAERLRGFRSPPEWVVVGAGRSSGPYCVKEDRKGGPVALARPPARRAWPIGVSPVTMVLAWGRAPPNGPARRLSVLGCIDNQAFPWRPFT